MLFIFEGVFASDSYLKCIARGECYMEVQLNIVNRVFALPYLTIALGG